jgi:tetratricopeptide (TPR) repeat protein
VKTPKNWIDTSNALHLSNFNKKNILSFIERGLIEFPNDSILLERKKVFEYELNAEKPGATFAISSKKPVSATEKYLYFLQRAINYGSKNQFDKALECYKEVKKNDPTNLTILQNIGICYFKLNQFQKAIVALEKVLTAPALQDGKTEYILGISYFNIKNKEKGCKYLKIASAKNFAGAQQVLQQNCK